MILSEEDKVRLDQIKERAENLTNENFEASENSFYESDEEIVEDLQWLTDKIEEMVELAAGDKTE